MYKIIGTDGKEYGPVTADQLRRWISEGRVNAHTRAQAEGSTEWQPISAFPEFALSLPELAAPAGGSVPPVPPSQPAASSAELPADLFQRPPDLDVMGCFSRAWELVTRNFGLVGGAAALMLVIQIFMGLLGMIPIVGALVSLASMIIGGPLLGGLYSLILRVIRNEPAEIGNLFDGLRLRFLQLFLTVLITGLLTGVALLPGALVVGLAVFIGVQAHEATAVSILIGAAGAVIIIIPVLFLSISWLFALPLVMDKNIEFWPAMEASRKVTFRVWIKVFVLVLLMGIINLVGAIPCGLGLFFTIPLCYSAMIYGYEDLFGIRPARAA